MMGCNFEESACGEMLMAQWGSVFLFSLCQYSRMFWFVYFQSFYPLLKKAAAANPDLGYSCSCAAVLNMSTGVASISDNNSGKSYPYRSAKVWM